MDIIQASKAFFEKYVVFSTRSSRSEYWWPVLMLVLLGALTGFVDSVLFMSINPETGQLEGIKPINSILTLLTLVPSIALGVRRLHDINRSGWWYLLWFVPVVGWIILIIWACTKGTTGDNRFGPDPLAPQMIGA